MDLLDHVRGGDADLIWTFGTTCAGAPGKIYANIVSQETYRLDIMPILQMIMTIIIIDVGSG